MWGGGVWGERGRQTSLLTANAGRFFFSSAPLSLPLPLSPSPWPPFLAFSAALARAMADF